MKSKIKLTQSAERYLTSTCGVARLDDLSLGNWVQTGDVVVLLGEPEPVNLIVNARRILLDGDGRQVLEIILDYPARPAV